MSEESNSELEKFRRQWQDEVLRRQNAPSQAGGSRVSQARGPGRDASPNLKVGGPSISKSHAYDDEYQGRTYDFDDLEAKEAARQLGTTGSGIHPESSSKVEDMSALECYEKAVESETQGKLGESLELYRRAFRVNTVSEFSSFSLPL
jgi:F-box protein 9